MTEYPSAPDEVIPTETLDAYIERLVDAWPPLSPEVRSRLTVLLRPSTIRRSA